MKRDYQNMSIAIIGAGATGRSLARFFSARGAKVILSDNRSADLLDSVDELKMLGVTLDLGHHTHELFTSAGLVVVSPGVPLVIPVLDACRAQGVTILGEVEVAWHELTGKVIGITGTNGKSTVTSLIGEMLG